MNRTVTIRKANGGALEPRGVADWKRRIRGSWWALGLGWGVAVFSGCSSSSSSSFHLAPQYAVDGAPTYGERLEGGEDMDLPMYTQGFVRNGEEQTLEGEEAKFRLRLGSNVTIETPTRAFSWEGVRTDGGNFGASSNRDTTNDNVLDTELTLVSQYMDFAHFGYWQEVRVDVSGDFAGSGGAFRHGLETNPANLPVLGTANYSGVTLGTGSHATAGDYQFEGSLDLTADSATGAVAGRMETFFNAVALTGEIVSNQFVGEATVSESMGAAVSFAPGTSGRLRGTFFGPRADEVGGVWSLQDDTNLAVGAFGGRQP